jgi:hypothetical protein
MFPEPGDLLGSWHGLIVHYRGQQSVEVVINPYEDSLRGTYSFDDSGEPGGEFSAELYGPWLSVRLSESDSHGPLHFHLHILSRKGPTMMYGAIPPRPGAPSRIPFATVTVFQGKGPFRIISAWESFFTELG